MKPPPRLQGVRLRAALGLRPRRALSSAEAQGSVAGARQQTMWVGEKSGFENYMSPVLLTTTVRFCSHHDNRKFNKEPKEPGAEIIKHSWVLGFIDPVFPGNRTITHASDLSVHQEAAFTEALLTS